MKKLKRRIIFLLIFLSVIIGGYSRYIEPNLLVSNNYTIESNKRSGKLIKVVQFSDTHLGEFFTLEKLEKVVRQINSEDPDIVIFTGDLMDIASEFNDRDKISNVLKKINAKYGKFTVYGNRDYGGGAKNYYKDIMEESGFELLINSSEVIDIDGRKVRILGADDAFLGTYNSKSTLKGITNDTYNILILHEPDLVDDFIHAPINLALAGHSHGGQVYIPYYGPIVKTELAEKYTKGFYNFDNEVNTQLYVNSGLGNTKIGYRLFNVPQILVFKISI